MAITQATLDCKLATQTPSQGQQEPSRLDSTGGNPSNALVRPVAPVLATLSSGRPPVSIVTTLVDDSRCARSVAGGGGAYGAVAAVSSCFGATTAVRGAVAGGRCLAARGAVTLLGRLDIETERREGGCEMTIKTLTLTP